MLLMRRKIGQWVEITHRSGDVIRFRLCEIQTGPWGQAKFAFDDLYHNFAIERPERQFNPPIEESA